MLWMRGVRNLRGPLCEGRVDVLEDENYEYDDTLRVDHKQSHQRLGVLERRAGTTQILENCSSRMPWPAAASSEEALARAAPHDQREGDRGMLGHQNLEVAIDEPKDRALTAGAG